MASYYDNVNIFDSQQDDPFRLLDPEYVYRNREALGATTPNLDATLGNIPSSAYQLGSDISNIVLHPIQTAKGIGQFGLGLAQLAIPGEQGNEDVARSVGQHFVDRYGSLDAAKQAVTTDPVGVLADVSALLLGGGYLATKAGMKAGQVATKVGLATDPLIATGRGVAGIGKGVTRRDVLKGTGAGIAALAVPMSMMTDVTKATKAIPPVAKSTGVLAGIGKFRGILDNLAPYMLGSEKRINILDETRKADAKVGKGRYDIDPIRNEQAIRNVFERKFPPIGHDSSFGLRVRTPKVINQMDQFGKKYNLKDSDFSILDTYKVDGIEMALKQSNAKLDVVESGYRVRDISKKLDNAPDKKFTIGKVKPKVGEMEHRLTTGTVDGVPVMKVEYYSEFVKGKMTKINEELYIPNKQGLEKLAKPKSTLDDVDIFAEN